MDEDVDPDEDDVNYILAQEFSELCCILRTQHPKVLMQLFQMMPEEDRRNIDHASSSVSAPTELIRAMLEYFRLASAADCRNFLQSMCLLCENIPMHLESRLMSVAAYPSIDASQSQSTEPASLSDKVFLESSTPSESSQRSSSPTPGQQLSKRPRIDFWEQYIAAVIHLLLRRWEHLSKVLVGEVHQESVWVSPRTTNRSKDRPDQTPGSMDRASRTPEPDGDSVSMEAKVTLETFLQGCTGKVTVLLGPAGSGKSLLMSHLGQQWACGLGPIPSSSLFVLLEFRQLSLLSRPLSLFDLLFHYYLPPQGHDDEKHAIVDYLLSNPEQSCWVLDGYDEFHRKLTKQEVQSEPWDPRKQLPVADLIIGLLNRQLLPGCTVLVTCRVRDAVDIEWSSDKVGQLLGWDCQQIKEYVNLFFGVKECSANRGVAEQAADLLLSNQHLLAMSSIPALCNICCICMEYLLLQEGDPGRMQMCNESGSATRTAKGKRLKGVHVPGERTEAEGSTGGSQAERRDHAGGEESVDRLMDVTNGSTQLPLTQVQIPSTLTQVYLTVLCAFLSHGPEKGGRNHKQRNTGLPQSFALMLSQYQSELCELSHLAWKGLEENRIMFMEEDISPHVLESSIRWGLFSKVEINREDGMSVKSFSFMHLTLQEFLGAVHIMTSQDVSDIQLKKRFSLKTRWTTKSDQRTVFTDSLHMFVCGLASPECTEALVQLAIQSSGTGGEKWVKRRQVHVRKLLKNLCQSNNLTGPKVLELCHCVQESQDHQLARQVVGTRPTLELRNIRLLPSDIDALAFVVNSVGDSGVGLDFGACSVEMECLDVLTKCQYIRYLCFRGRKYGDKLTEKLSTVLSKFKMLRKLELCGASVSATGAASLASALKDSPNISEINLSDNNLKDEGIEHIASVFDKLPRLGLIMLGRNNSSLKTVNYLIRKMSLCLNIQRIYAEEMCEELDQPKISQFSEIAQSGTKEVTVTFSQNSDLSGHHTHTLPTISLLNQKWSNAELQHVAEALTCCPALSVLDLSGGQWDIDTLKTVTQLLPKFNVTKKIILNESCFSLDGLLILTTLLSDCPSVMELHVRLQSPVQVLVELSCKTEQPVNETTKSLCLSCCDLQPADLERVCRSLRPSSDLTVIDLSNNCLGNKGLKKLLDVVPLFRSIREINATNNEITMGGVAMLAGAFCSHHNLTHIVVSDRGKEKLILKFCPGRSVDKTQLKIFSLIHSNLLPADVTTICKRLVQCHSHFELDFSHSLLTDNAIQNLLTVLPKMSSLQRLNVSHCISSTSGAVMLLSCLTVSRRVKSVDLRSQSDSVTLLDSVKAEQASCRLTGFRINNDNYESLLKVLQQGPQLSYLDLSGNHLEDDRVKQILDTLPKLKILNYVNLSSNSLTQRGLLDVISTVCVCDSVSGAEVSLGAEQRCFIWFSQDEGCEKNISVRGSCLAHDHLLRVAETVDICSRLFRLELRYNSLESDWITDLLKLLNTSQRGLKISIEEHWIKSEEAVLLLCRCLELCSNVHSVGVFQNTLHLSLDKNTKLTTISLVDCAVEGYQLTSMTTIIQKFPSLTELNFSHNSLGVKGAEFLSDILPSLPNLTSLNIGSKETCVTVAEKISQSLLQAATIKCLNLSSHVISDTAAQIMTRILPHLRSLNLSNCLWTEAGGLQLIRALGQCDSLKSLCLDSLQLSEESGVCLAQALRNVNSICALKLNKVAAVDMGLDLLASMEGLTQMEEIELEGWGMAERAVEKLTRTIRLWKKLRKINLSKNLISDQSGDRLLEALSSCTHLEELHLSRNNLGDLTAARMAFALPSLTNITVLDISENHIQNDGSASLSKAIKCLKNLTKINLTSVGTPELCAVAASLAYCPFIQDVRLGWNNCGDEVAEELARVIPLCQKLIIIDLESNTVSITGAEALVKALQSCPALKLIRLWRNKISPSEAERLSQRDRRLNFSST